MRRCALFLLNLSERLLRLQVPDPALAPELVPLLLLADADPTLPEALVEQEEPELYELEFDELALDEPELDESETEDDELGLVLLVDELLVGEPLLPAAPVKMSSCAPINGRLVSDPKIQTRSRNIPSKNPHLSLYAGDLGLPDWSNPETAMLFCSSWFQ